MLTGWSNDYSLGVEEIDEQHRSFFAAIHRLHDAILNCEGEKAVDQALEFLRQYASRHFRAEEAFMDSRGFPGLERHRRLHADFLDALDGLLEELRLFGASQDLADRVSAVAQDWLIDHIIDEDAQYAAHAGRRPRR